MDRLTLMQTIATLPSTNFRIAVTLSLAVFTTVFLLVLMAVGVDPNEVVVGILYGYLAAQGGWDYKQFQAKRETYAAPSPDSERAHVPTTPAPSTPADVAKPAAVPKTADVVEALLERHAAQAPEKKITLVPVLSAAEPDAEQYDGR